MKDVTIDRKGPREILKKSLDEMFAPPIDPGLNRDARRGQAVRHRLGDATSSARTSSIWATPWPTRSC